eukprot:1656897-Amphidinium_carterae.2
MARDKKEEAHKNRPASALPLFGTTQWHILQGKDRLAALLCPYLPSRSSILKSRRDERSG